MMTRKKIRKVGGSFLGEGVTGKTVNAGCRPGGNSFCKEIEGKEDTVEKIVLYKSKKNTIEITEKDEIYSFIHFVHALRGRIAKVMKDPPPFLKRTKQDIFFEELASNEKINNIYGNQAEKYLTTSPLQYKNKDILGAQVFFQTKLPLFVVFGQKCKNKFALKSNGKVKQWTHDILNSLVLLQKKNYMHNDIKPDNTVLCDDQFKLIDWGFASPMEYSSFSKTDGDDMFISPIRWYMTGISREVSFSKLEKKTKRKNKKLFYSSLWKDILSYLQDEIDYTISLHLSKEELFKKYKNSLDVMMVGLSLVEIIHDSHLNWNSWKSFITKILSHRNPLSAEGALHEFHYVE